MKKLFITIALGAAAIAASAVTPLWIRDVKISPDGSEIAFTYKGDIYKVPATGGMATRLTTLAAYDAEPIWSPDGKSIAFQSDRNGSLDLYIMPANGGKATRLTTFSGRETPEAFTPDGKYVLFSAVIQDPVKSAAFPSARLSELYKVPVGGGRIEQVLGTPALRVSVAPDNSYMLYEDVKAPENEWRKHHTSSASRDVWMYDVKTGKHTNMSNHAGEDRNPVVGADGKTLLFLSERNGGSMNVYAAPMNNPADVKALTQFKEHPVRFLSQGSDGTIAMGYDGEIYTMKAGQKPVKVKVEVVEDTENPTSYLAVAGSASGGMPSPDNKMVAFTRRGDVFVTSVEYKTTKQITNTPQAEGSITWGSDNRTLYYVSERDGYPTIYSATIERESDPDFPNATKIKEEALIKAENGVERTYPQVSPDGKKLAFVQNRNRLMVMDLKSKKVRQITDGKVNPSRMDLDYQWSPDSKWLAFTMNDNRHDPYYNIGLVNVEGEPKVLNLTNDGYFDMDMRWSADGNAIIFLTDRYGMRSHASWGSQNDVMAVFLNQEAYDRMQMNEEDRKLYDEAKKKAESNAGEDKKDSKKKKDGGKDAADSKKEEKSKDIVVEPEGFENRTMRLTPYSSDVASAALNGDMTKLYYLSAVEKGYDLWKIDLVKGDIAVVSKLDAPMLTLIPDAKGKNIYLMGPNTMKKLDTGTEKIKNITYTGRMKLDRAAEREYMFDYVKRQERERFYEKGMHGVNWDRMTEHYSRFLPHINNNYDFSEMLSELLGELNVSHTGSGYRGTGAYELTANLGLLYDLDYEGKGLKVAEIVTGGPFAKAMSKLAPGMVIESINGEAIGSDGDYTTLLNGLVDTKTLIGIYNPATGERFEEVIRPISNGTFQDLLYTRWVRQRAADVDRMSNGRLGYVHIRSMADPSFRDLYADVLGKYNTRDGIVIDTRWNGGGRMHEDIEVMFSGKKYLTQVVRGTVTGEMPSKRWNKPSIMVVGEGNYSNAHGTPWVYSTRGLGKTVGMPVPGTMTSVNWVTLQDPTLYFGIPIIGYRTEAGNYLENTQLEPDIKIANDPAVVVTGEDQQLRRAVEELLKDIDAAKK